MQSCSLNSSFSLLLLLLVLLSVLETGHIPLPDVDGGGCDGVDGPQTSPSTRTTARAGWREPSSSLEALKEVLDLRSCVISPVRGRQAGTE